MTLKVNHKKYLSSLIVVVLLISVFCTLVFNTSFVGATSYVTSDWESSEGTDVTDGGLWDSASTPSPAVSDVQAHGGNYSLQCNVTQFVTKTFSATTTIVIDYWCYISAHPSGSTGTIRVKTATDATVLILVRSWDGHPRFFWRYNDTYAESTSTTSWTLNSWHHIVLSATIADGTGGSYSVYIDDEEVTDLTKTGLDNNNWGNVNYVEFGVYENSGEMTAYFDDAYIGNSPLGSSDPEISNVSVSSYIVSQPVQFNATFNDTLALHSNGQYIFGCNITGSMVWEDAVNFTSTPQTVSVSKTLPSTVGSKIVYTWNYTDNSGAAVSSSYSFYAVNSKVFATLLIDWNEWYYGDPVPAANWGELGPFTPALGSYSNSNTTIIDQQIEWMDYAGLDVCFITLDYSNAATWMNLFLGRAATLDSHVKFAAYFNGAGNFNAETNVLLTGVEAMDNAGVFDHEKYYKWDGVNPVISGYLSAPADGWHYEYWTQVKAAYPELSIWAHGWHPNYWDDLDGVVDAMITLGLQAPYSTQLEYYSSAEEHPVSIHGYTVSAGFDNTGIAGELTLTRANGQTFIDYWENIPSNADVIWVGTWNEYGECSGIEPISASTSTTTTAFNDLYLNLTRLYVDRFSAEVQLLTLYGVPISDIFSIQDVPIGDCVKINGDTK